MSRRKRRQRRNRKQPRKGQPVRRYPDGLLALALGAFGVLDIGGILAVSSLPWSRGEHVRIPLLLPLMGVAALIMAVWLGWQWWRERADRHDRKAR